MPSFNPAPQTYSRARNALARGDRLLAAGEIELARDAYWVVLRYMPWPCDQTSSESDILCANAMVGLGRVDRAREEWQCAIEDFLEALDIFMRLEDAEKATRVLRDVAELAEAAPPQHDIVEELAGFLQMDIDAAADVLRRCATLPPPAPS